MNLVEEIASLKSCIAELVQVDDEEVSKLVDRYLEDATVEVPDVRNRRLTMQIHFSPDVHVVIIIPSGYPKCQPQVTLHGLGSREVQSDTNIKVQNLLQDDTIEQYTVLYEIVLLIKSCLDSAVADSQARLGGDQSPHTDQKSDMQIQDAAEEYGRIMFYAHHLLAVSKRKDIQAMSRELELNIICKTGYPGLIAAEGTRGAVETLTKEIKSMRWHTIALKYERYETCKSTETWRSKSILEVPFVETTDMSFFAHRVRNDPDWLKSIIH